jgi:nucleoside recognition membrane protein YjiH
MHATFFQKVIICAIAGFLAAALLEWGKMFVTGADDALNKGYKHTAPGVTLRSKP